MITIAAEQKGGGRKRPSAVADHAGSRASVSRPSSPRARWRVQALHLASAGYCIASSTSLRTGTCFLYTFAAARARRGACARGQFNANEPVHWYCE
eukprot:COSAG03_NODE_542_length_7066_cov_460.167760_7_plen_96_part_00